MTKAMALPVIWVVDTLDVVHSTRCDRGEGPNQDYITAARTAGDLVANLARPDSHERHQGAGRLKHCHHCIGLMVDMEGAAK